MYELYNVHDLTKEIRCEVCERSYCTLFEKLWFVDVYSLPKSRIFTVTLPPPTFSPHCPSARLHTGSAGHKFVTRYQLL
jgi:hypothetical protein